jgi:hypothetical protein
MKLSLLIYIYVLTFAFQRNLKKMGSATIDNSSSPCLNFMDKNNKVAKIDIEKDEETNPRALSLNSIRNNHNGQKE